MGVGTGVAVGTGVGLGVDVGTGVAVGFGVGLGVIVGVAVGTTAVMGAIGAGVSVPPVPHADTVPASVKINAVIIPGGRCNILRF